MHFVHIVHILSSLILLFIHFLFSKISLLLAFFVILFYEIALTQKTWYLHKCPFFLHLDFQFFFAFHICPSQDLIFLEERCNAFLIFREVVTIISSNIYFPLFLFCILICWTLLQCYIFLWALSLFILFD
jgi:hypothetical protein